MMKIIREKQELTAINKIEKVIEPEQMTPGEDAMEAYVRQTERVHKRHVRIKKSLQYFGMVLVFAAILFVKSRESTATSKNTLSNQVIRFHVLANSDTKEDQALKLKVKNKVVVYMQKLLQDCTSKEEAEHIITDNMEQMLKVARQVIKEEGYHYTVTAKLEQHYFPVKTYGNQVYPEGEYEALRVLIGKAEGKNWWCVMFPSLCMLNDTYTVVPEETLVPEPEPEEEQETEYRFFLIDWLKDLF